MSQLNPLTSPYPMSWTPTGCNWCGADEIVWAYPVGMVRFWRNLPDGEIKEIDHHAQPWFACRRCRGYVDRSEWDELATVLGQPHGYFNRLRAAKLDTNGYEWQTARSVRPSLS